jgi:TniQ protein
VAGQLLLIRPRPLDDELFSSWLVRLAWSNGEKLHTFCRWRLGIGRNVWNQDPDRLAEPSAIARSAAATGLPLTRVLATSLAAYEGTLYERHVRRGVSRWIMPIGLKARAHLRHGQQYCVGCLREDSVPYFRRAWRLAFIVACTRHGQILADACPACGIPVSFHEGDFARRFASDTCPIAICRGCGQDLREHVGRPAEKELLEYQRRLEGALESGWFLMPDGKPVFAISFFDGMHALLRILSSNTHLSSIRAGLLQERGGLALPIPFGNGALRFEHLRLGDRHFLMQLLASVMDDWPRGLLRQLQTRRNFELVPSGLQACLPFLVGVGDPLGAR